jgi:hypothetical protein
LYDSRQYYRTVTVTGVYVRSRIALSERQLVEIVRLLR